MNRQPEASNSGNARRRNTTSASEKTKTSLAACLECRSRKVKCNRELPTCSNCEKSGGHCEFPDPEKKASQTKQLAEDVATFNGRLSTMEQSMTRRMEVLTGLVSQSVKNPGGHRAHSSTSSSEVMNEYSNSDIDEEAFSDQSSPNSSGGLFSPTIIVNDGAVERFYGASSTYSHLVNSRSLVEKLLTARKHHSPNQVSRSRNSMQGSSNSPTFAARDSTTYAEVQQKYDSYSGPSKFKEHFEIGDDKRLELPPRRELEDAIESYLSEHSLEPPLFQKQTLIDAVSEQYQVDRLGADESWTLCFNNIILRSSAWKSRSFRVNSFSAPSADDSLLSLLLANANRALRQLERFCVLRMVNIQALFLLALIARDSIHFNVFERIFDRVCQLAKQMGLHERGIVSDNPTLKELERQNVLWVLYSVDKQRIFIRGPPCRIYLFECHIRLPRADDSRQQLVAANLRLTCLVEELYRHLYAPKASRKDLRTRQKIVNRLQCRLENLLRQFENILTSTERVTSVEMMMSLQLRHSFYVTKLLIHSNAIDEQSKQLRLNIARKALQIIQKVVGQGFLFNSYVAILERIFCSYSVIAFHEVFDNMLTEPTNPASSTDLFLLTTATNALRLLSHPDKPYSYCARLHKNFTWCTEIATLLHNSRKPAIPPEPSRSHSGVFENTSAPPASAFEPYGFQSQKGTAAQQFGALDPRSTHDFDGDLHMDGSGSGPGGMGSDRGLTSVSSSLNPSDFNCSAFPNPLTNDHASMFTLTPNPNNNDFGPNKTDDLTDLLSQQPPLPPSSLEMQMPLPQHKNSGSAAAGADPFQDALKWVFDEGDSLDVSFQQTMTGQGMPMVGIGKEGMYGV